MNLLIMGPPGAGKGTQAELLVEKFGLVHISTGDMFRSAMKNKTKFGMKAKEFMDQGLLVPDEVTNCIVKERLEQNDVKSGFLLDGYPRSDSQAIELEKILKELDLNLSKVINIEVDYEILTNRIIGRRICKGCGISYHLEFRKPKVDGICDKCGSELYQRKDDNIDTVQSRLEVYNKQTKPILDIYKSRELLANINGLGKLEEIHNKISDLIKE